MGNQNEQRVGEGEVGVVPGSFPSNGRSFIRRHSLLGSQEQAQTGNPDKLLGNLIR